MQRIQTIDETQVDEKTTELLAAVKQQMGGVPNIIKTMAQSSAALSGFLGFAGALGDGEFSAKLREQIALAVAGANQCDYCASAHTAVGAGLGIDADELDQNLSGMSADTRVSAILTFAKAIVRTSGNPSDAELSAARTAGLTDSDIVEVIANVSLNIFTNYFNHIAQTEIDFPVVKTSVVAAA